MANIVGPTPPVPAFELLCNGGYNIIAVAAVTTNGFTDDRRDWGPSAAILLHNASQLLITLVNLPLSSPISTCNAGTAHSKSGTKLTPHLKEMINKNTKLSLFDF